MLNSYLTFVFVYSDLICKNCLMQIETHNKFECLVFHNLICLIIEPLGSITPLLPFIINVLSDKLVIM